MLHPSRIIPSFGARRIRNSTGLDVVIFRSVENHNQAGEASLATNLIIITAAPYHREQSRVADRRRDRGRVMVMG